MTPRGSRGRVRFSLLWRPYERQELIPKPTSRHRSPVRPRGASHLLPLLLKNLSRSFHSMGSQVGSEKRLEDPAVRRSLDSVDGARLPIKRIERLPAET